MKPHLESLTEAVVHACKEADERIIAPLRRSYDRLKVESKDDSGRNFVTTADLETEHHLKEALHKLVPEAGFIAEESFSGQPEKPLNWIIDPIDGTTNFMHGMPPFCISVALAEGEEVLLGVVYELFSKECFLSWKGGGAWLDGHPLRISPTSRLGDALLVTGFPYEHGARFDRWMDIFKQFTQTTRGVRRLGAAAVDMAYVAGSRFDGFYEYNLQPWDVAAGTLLCREAGGTVTDFQGGNDFLFGQRMVCSNGILHDALLRALENFDG